MGLMLRIEWVSSAALNARDDGKKLSVASIE